MHTIETKDCDFCGDHPVTWRFPCSPFTLKKSTSIMTYRGDWAACETCKPLVEDRRWDELVERTLAKQEADMIAVYQDIARQTGKQPAGLSSLDERTRQYITADILQGWERFTRNRRGPAVPVAEGDVSPDPIIRVRR